MKKNKLWFLVIAIALIGAGCNNQYAVTPAANPTVTPPAITPSPAPAAVKPSVKTVFISNFAFDPAAISIQKGDTVTWQNKDSVAHTVIIDNEAGSAPLLKDQTFTHTFATAGHFIYHCGIHPSMKGTVDVK